MKSKIILGIASFLCLAAAAAAGDDQNKADKTLQIHDGDRIVFLGDSITEQRLYTTYLEAYWLTRFPSYKLSFRNVGWGGDTSWFRRRFNTDENVLFAAAPEAQQAMIDKAVAAGLDRDVLPLKPSIVTVAFGMNDHSYQAFRQDICDTYARCQTRIAKTLQSQGSQVVFLTPQPLEETQPHPDQDQRNQSLKKFAERLRDVATAENTLFVDQFSPYMLIMLKAREANGFARVGGGDVIHPGPPGQLLMAWSILKKQGAPSSVSSVELNLDLPADKQIVASENTAISKISQEKDVISFDSLDKTLPMPIDERADAALALAPISDDLNRYIMKVTGLKSDNYEIQIDDTKVCFATREELAKGCNLSHLSSPISQQAQEVLKEIIKKNDLYFERWRNCQLTGNHARLPDLDRSIAESEARIDALRQPKIHHFRIAPCDRIVEEEIPLAQLSAAEAPQGSIWLDTLDMTELKQGFGKVGIRSSIDNRGPITINKQVFNRGIGTHAHSEVEIDLDGKATRFVSAIGVDDKSGPAGSVTFQVWVDGVKKSNSGLILGQSAHKVISVDLRGVKRLKLVVTDGGNGPACDLADWAGACIFTADPKSIKVVTGGSK